MAATVDSVSNATASTTTPVTWAHTLGGGSNLVMVVLISGAGATRAAVSSVVYDAGGTNQTLSQLASSRADGSYAWSEIWYRKAPSGNHNITVTLDQNNECYCGAIVIKDAHQTTTFGTPTAGTGSSDPAVCTVSSGTDEAAVAAIAAARNASETLTPTVGVERWNLNNGAGTSVASGVSIVGSASAAFSWTESAGMDYAASGVSVKPAAGGAVSAPQFMMMGVG